jgi:uncharacterized protein
MRFVFNMIGLILVGIGIVGIFVPLLPTTIFFILAAIIFAKSNPKWETMIMSHPRFGPQVKAFRERGVISPKAKLMALLGMALSSAMGFVFIKGILGFVPLGVCLVCALYVLSRPSK